VVSRAQASIALAGECTTQKGQAYREEIKKIKKMYSVRVVCVTEYSSLVVQLMGEGAKPLRRLIVEIGELIVGRKIATVRGQIRR
jgi:CO dehydrogenase/acetyl-CoA synthase epsilon subunit